MGTVLAVMALSVVVGFVGSEHGFGWELAAVFGTAFGTTLLAVATGLLALLTWRDVSAAQELAQLTRDEAGRTNESLRVAGEQAETARQSLDAQTQPFLTVGSIGPGNLDAGRAHLRNTGNATAVITSVVFCFRDGDLPGAAVDPAVPPGEGTSIVLSGGSPPTSGPPDFSVAAAYADVSGRPRGAVRLDVYQRPTPPAPDAYTSQARWWVRQVHWADTFDQIRTEPKLSSPPVE